MLRISELYIYPIKSLAGISLKQARVERRGLQYDRRWMLVDPAGRFLTQREHPQMALLQVSVTEKGLLVYRKTDPDQQMLIPFEQTEGTPREVVIWEDTCQALPVSVMADRWFTQQLQMDCSLVYMPEDSLRKVDPRYAAHEEIAAFSDAYPMLLIGQASLDDLNSRLQQPVGWDRFRPNIVFTGGRPYEEDDNFSFQINGISFRAVKPCARCVMTTVNQQTGEKGKEPLRTLAAYRTVEKKVLFGQNLLHDGPGHLQVGDVLNRHW